MKIPEITLFRFNEWKGNNFNLLLTNYYLWTLYLQVPFFEFINNFIFLILLFLCLLSFAYYLNDVADIEKDKLANKVNKAQDHSRRKQILILLILVVLPLIYWLLFARGNLNILLGIVLVIILSFTYSSNAIRLKETAVFSVINDVLAAQIAPNFIILALYFDRFSSKDYLVISLFILWILFVGIKFITGHHLKDAKNDIKSNTYTSVSKFGYEKVLVFYQIVFPILEFIIFTILIFKINKNIWFVFLSYLVYIAIFHLRNNFKNYITDKRHYDPMNDLGYRLLTLFHIRILPLIALSSLIVIEVKYSIILIFHVFFFYENSIYLYQDFKNSKGFSFNLWSKIKLFANYLIWKIFYFIGIDLKKADQNLSLSNKILQLKNNKIRKPYNYGSPNWAYDFTANLDEIIQEWTEYAKNHQGINIDELSSEQAELNNDKKWKSLILFGYSYYNNPLEQDFPILFNCIKKHESNLTLVMFSITEAGKIIPPHHGNNHGVLRLQIGIDIQEPEKCYLRVEDKKMYLKNKELFVFDDTFEHELVNNSEQHRTVLIIDYYKPLPYFYDKLNRMQIKKMRNSDYVQNVVNKF